MADYALIGGRSIPHIKDFTLEEKIFKALSYSVYKILYIPLACYPNLYDSIRKFKELVPQKYTIDVLENYENYFEMIQKFEEADVIYFGGGCAEELVSLSKRYGIDSILASYQNKKKLFMGVSAGAILFSQYGMGDRYSYKDINHIYNYQMVQGLGILDFVICPHYDHDGLDCFNEEVKAYGLDGYALEDDTAILVSSGLLTFKQDPQRSVYFFDSHQNYLMKPLYEEKK